MSDSPARRLLRDAEDALGAVEDDDLRVVAEAFLQSNRAVVTAIKALTDLVDRKL